MCLTENQLLPNQNTDNISQLLNDFESCHNCCDDKFQRISFCYRQNTEVTQFSPTIDASLIEFKKLSFSQNSFRIFLLYHKHGSSLTSFYDILRRVKQPNIYIYLLDTSISMPKKDQTPYHRCCRIISN